MVPVAPYFSSCVYDLCACNDKSACLCDILASYAKECAKAGMRLEWRSQTLCGKFICFLLFHCHPYYFSQYFLMIFLHEIMKSCLHHLRNGEINYFEVPVLIYQWQIFSPSKWKAFADDKINLTWTLRLDLIIMYQHFLLFLRFSKIFFLMGVIKSEDCVVKG